MKLLEKVSNPSFRKISNAFNLNYNIIKNHKDLKTKKIISSKGQLRL